MGRVVTNPTGSVVDASEVKILYESNENTNAYTDGDKASLGEVKNAIDMAKKVVEITFLLNNWTSNSDGTYSQTVNNSEIKSSMNPDLISMLSSGATPEEQKAYMKNFSILCQGVGNTADGSVTYKIYKQMTGDITVGLTRLGGVRQIESEAKVDDVKVGGVSVVKDKVAEIPEIPDSSALVPYEGATKNVELGNHLITVKTEPADGLAYRTIVTPQGVGVDTVLDDDSSQDFITFTLDGISSTRELSIKTNTGNLQRLNVLTPFSPTNAATKQYVDDRTPVVATDEITQTQENAPVGEWQRFFLPGNNSKDITSNNFLGAMVWITGADNTIDTDIDYVFAPNISNTLFNGIDVACKNTGTDTTKSYIIKVRITYLKKRN